MKLRRFLVSLREDKDNSQLVIDLVNMEREQLPLRKILLPSTVSHFVNVHDVKAI